ncbi:FecR domain-containing protein [Novosphingobium sp. RD2P27]|uniref:FecR domain-containing protein n=1 Tax=Novosphingobium kalidii TaxID=3230299 RepID=A0ABV2D345_9SPHN
MTSRSKLEGPDRQAAEWLARLHADDRAHDDEEAFRSWLKADRANERSFENASEIWTAVGGLREEHLQQLQNARPAPVRMSRRAVVAGGGALFVTAGVTAGWQSAYAGVYSTGVGEQRRFVLEDGSRAMLDTATLIRFRSKSDIRMLSLEAGRIDLDIAADSRPFVIDMGERQATVTSARLDVQRTGKSVALTAVSGVARINTSPGGSLAVPSGSRIAMVAGDKDKLDRPELEDLMAWQSGRLALRDDTLSYAIAEMNRYSRRTLVAADPKVAGLRFSGVYRLGDPEAFARSLALLLPIRVEVAGDLIRIEGTG